MRKFSFLVIISLSLMMVMGACAKKKVVSVDKLRSIIEQSVIAEQLDSGRTLVVDTIFLNKENGDNYAGTLRGHINDSIEVVYDIQVNDENDEMSIEWNRQ